MCQSRKHRAVEKTPVAFEGYVNVNLATYVGIRDTNTHLYFFVNGSSTKYT